MPRSSDTFRQLEALAFRYGFSFDGHTGKGHFKWRHPAGPVVFTVSKLDGSTGFRELKNSERKFRAATSAAPASQ